ncbi:hypothetical protein GCM10023089_39580 [Quisquiliibacterium transsilvanicum]
MFVVAETFLNPGEPSSADYRLRPIPGQAFPVTMRVQASRAQRMAFPLGTRFRLPVELVETKTGALFLRVVGQQTWQVWDGRP